MWWRKAMHMLGLEDEAPDYDPVGRGRDLDRSSRDHGPGSSSVPVGSAVNPMSSNPVQPEQPSAGSMPVGMGSSDEPSGIGVVRPIRTGQTRMDEPLPKDPTTGSVRRVVKPVPMAANAKPHLVRPMSFDEAQAVADNFKRDQPVVMDLQDAGDSLSRRLIDFASGLCYGLGGQMERVDTQVYLLTPANVSVSDEERRRLRERSYDD